MYFPLQAASADGGMTAFNIEDCPKLVDDEFFYLSNRPGTALLRKDSIFRGSDMFSSSGKRIFEGDILRSENDSRVYAVQFFNGFKIRSQDGEMRLMDHVKPFEHLGNWLQLRGRTGFPQWLDSHFQPPKLGKVRYWDFAQNIKFGLFDIISASDDSALIYKDGGKIVVFRDIGQFTGIKYPPGNNYYYGQHINGLGSVAIRFGDPGVLTIKGFRSFSDQEFRKSLNFM